ncbi:MAG: trigger factor, partial [Tannerella sp.]|nr:trigger factor [Tannerella sp.]
IEEVNKIVSENVSKYIEDNHIRIVGEPLPNETEQQNIDFDTQEDFEFYFDLAIAPELNINLSKDDTLISYQIDVDDELVEKQLDSYRKNFGSYDDTADTVEESDLVKGVVSELENGEPKEGGILVENGILMPSYLKEKEEQAKFIGAKQNDIVVFNPNKAYQGAYAEIASFLKIDKETAENLTSDFRFEVKEITRHKEAELNQELFDKVLGDNVVTSAEEFRAKVKESLADQFLPRSEYNLMLAVRDLLVQKAEGVKFAEDILKRWLIATDDKNTPEKVDNDYPNVEKELKYLLSKDQLMKANGLKVQEEDVQKQAQQVAKSQFAQYGMFSVPDDILANYAKDLLKNKENLQSIVSRATEDVLVRWVKTQVNVETKNVSYEEFERLF